MKRQVSLEEISDGKLYGAQDMVRADCQGCQGCSACCHGMGTSIILDPLDCFRLSEGLGLSLEALLQDKIELNVVDGIILPNLKMAGGEEGCAFLNGEGRCSIHPYRPGICRLFPLGRYYDGTGFRYFLQIHECRMENRSKVKVKKWIDTPDLKRYEKFVSDWHYYLMELEEAAARGGEKAKQISMYLLQQFYLKPYAHGEDFYPQFEQRLREGKQFLEQTREG